MTEQTASNVPQIRFKGFEGEWEEEPILSRIRSVIDFRGRTPKKLGLDWSPSGYLALSALNVKDGYIDRYADAHYGDEELYTKWMKGNELHCNQVLFTTEAPMGNVAQIPDTQKYILSQRTIAFITDAARLSEDYLAVLLKSPNVFGTLLARSSGGTAKGVSQKSLSSIHVRVSDELTEQTQIGEYFRELDRLIGLHQRKHDKLVTLKKAMLQKMFPQPGATTPEIRFKGFSEAWKEKELGELVIFFKGKGLSKSEIDPSGTEPCIHYGQLFTEYSEVISTVISKAKGGNSYFRSIANDVLMPTSDVTPRGLAKASAIYESDVIIGGDILVIRGDKKLLLGSFLSRFIRYMESQVLQMVSGSTVFHLYSSSMEKFRVKYPSVSEQQKIGTYFRTLDSLISKHAIQLKKLKQIKSACLEKMFV